MSRLSSARAGKVNGWTAVMVVVVTLVVFFLVVWVFGGVQGEEFSAQSFTMRRFRYFQLPLVKLPVWPVSFERVRGNEDAMAKYVRSQRWVGGVARQPERWDVVTKSEVGSLPQRGDASMLTSYLLQPAKGTSESWIDWSRKHSELAQRMWPLVARLAHEHVYELVPDVMEAARAAQNEQEFTAHCEATLPDLLSRLAAAEEQVGRDEQAAKLKELSREVADLAQFSPAPQSVPQDVAAEADPQD